MGKRVLYATPTADQVTRFWFEVKRALAAPLDAGVFYKNETEHIIELPKTEKRIRAKTAWNADTLRGDYADVLILDEYQLMSEDAWGVVGAPMLLDRDGDAVFVYTPPSFRTAGTSKAQDKMHAAKLYTQAQADTTGRWSTFHFTSHDNPYISAKALAEVAGDLSGRAYRQEILAEDLGDVPGALFSRAVIDAGRVLAAPPLVRVVVAVDPAATSKDTSDECGIVTAGATADKHGYILADNTLRGTPTQWAREAIAAYYRVGANCIVAEANNGGEMIETVIHGVDSGVPVKLVYASKSKQTRAEPASMLYEQGKVHHVGTLAALEDEMCSWLPLSGKSPNRIDALVWGLHELGLSAYKKVGF